MLLRKESTNFDILHQKIPLFISIDSRCSFLYFPCHLMRHSHGYVRNENAEKKFFSIELVVRNFGSIGVAPKQLRFVSSTILVSIIVFMKVIYYSHKHENETMLLSFYTSSRLRLSKLTRILNFTIFWDPLFFLNACRHHGVGNDYNHFPEYLSGN